MKTLSTEEMMMVSGAGNYADKHGMGNPKSCGNSNNKGNPRQINRFMPESLHEEK